jgi:phosphoribosylformylglycinamidine (FGAM) synthase PurS component
MGRLQNSAQNNADDVSLDNDQRDGDEDANAMVEYLLANTVRVG